MNSIQTCSEKFDILPGARALFGPSGIWCALIAALILLCPGWAIAQASGTGTISGSVINASTQKVLERAVVSVSGTNLSTFTLPDGHYRLHGVPAGTHSVQVTYASLEDATASVEVTAGANSPLNFALKSDVVQLETVTVSAEPEGNAYAVQQQKNGETQRNIVSADAFGVVTDANPGEFLKLMPGIQMDYTGIEPRGLMVRGMEPNLNLVMINGNQAAHAASSGTNRQYEFDQTTIDNIESIEVYKAPVPWMPANSIGGTVNMVTRSAFLQKGRRISATVNLTANSDLLTLSPTSGPNESDSRKIHPGGSFTFSDSFLDGRLGVVFSFSQVNVNGFGGTAYNTYTYLAPLPAAPAPYTTASPNAYVSRYEREDHQNYTTRSGGSLNLDYKVSDTMTVYLRTTLTDHYYEFRNRFLRLNTGTIVGTPSPGRVETTGGNAEQSMSFGNKFNGSWSFNPGAKHRFDDWTVEYDGSVSRATNHYDYLPWMFGGVTVRTSGVGYVLEKDPGRATAVKITQTAGADIYNLGNGAYVPTGNGITVGNRSSVDRIMAGKARVRRDFTGPNPYYLEAGVAYQQQERKRQNPSKRWNYAGPDGVIGTADDTTGANMQQFAEQEYTPNIWFGERAPNAWISPFQLAKLYEQAPQAFIEDQGNSYDVAYRANQKIQETIFSYYAMGNVKFGPLDILAGLRLEETYVDGEGARQNNAAAAGLTVNSLAYHIARLSRTKAGTHYTSDPFKYLHLTWHANKQLQARASYAESIGRPNFGDILPGLTVNETARTVSVANTELLPQRSKNIDLSVEWYPGRTGVLSAAWFSKDIDDYIVNNSFTVGAAMPELGIGPELVNYVASTKGNLGNAKIEGFELAARYQLSPLPGWLRNFEVFGNYTKLYKTQGTFNAAAATTVYDQLPNLGTKIWNAGISYTTSDRKLYLSLRTNYVSDIPRNITGRPQEQSNERQTVEGEIRYSLTPRYTLSLAGRNILEAEEGGSQIGRAIRTGTGGGSALTLTLAGRF